MAFAPSEDSHPAAPPGPVIARLQVRFVGPAFPPDHPQDGPAGNPELLGSLYDPSGERGFVAALLDLLDRRRRCAGELGELRGEPDNSFAAELPSAELHLLESGNTVVILGDRLVLKLYRRLEEGTQPELEMNRVLRTKTSFTHVPAILGSLTYHSEKGEATILGIVEEFVANEGDAWRLTLDALHRFFDSVLARTDTPPQLEGQRSVIELSDYELPIQARELLSSYLETAHLLARRIGELHVALASITDDPDFTPDLFTLQYQRSLYQSMRGRLRQTLAVLRRQLHLWPEPLRESAARVAQNEDKLMRLARRIYDRLIEARRIRCHGHLNLGHLLSTGKDFIVLDLEGEPDRSLAHRRRKRSPVRDLAGLHFSLQEAAVAAPRLGGVRSEDVPALEAWARFWLRWASVAFLKEYRAVPGTAALLPPDSASLIALFDFYRLGWNITGLRHELGRLTVRAPMVLRNLVQLIERA